MKNSIWIIIGILALLGCREAKFGGKGKVKDTDPPPSPQPSSEDQAQVTGQPTIDARDGVLDLKGIIIGKIEVRSVIDHTSELVVTDKELYFRHTNLGFPADTTLDLWDAAGAKIDTKNWKPLFRESQGTNCPNVKYCTDVCDCLSDKVTFDKPTALQGNVTKVSGRGFLQGGKNPDGTISSKVWDCGKDCNSPDPNRPKGLGGVDTYDWIVQ